MRETNYRVSTESSVESSAWVVDATVHFNIIVWAGFLLLNFERYERELNVSSSCSFDDPFTVRMSFVCFIAISRVRINIFKFVVSCQATSANGGMRSKETLSMHASVRVEEHKHWVRCWGNGVRQFGAAEPETQIFKRMFYYMKVVFTHLPKLWLSGEFPSNTRRWS